MPLYDVTRTLIEGMPTYPGEPGPELTSLKRIADGDPANVSRLSLGVHTGTHVDAPVHFFEGAAGAETLPLDALCGPVRVVGIDDPEAVRVPELERAGLDGVQRVLFKTRNGELASDPSFRRDFVSIGPEAAEWLVARDVRLVGVDYLSVEAFGAPEPRTHRTLLAARVVIIEGLDLREPPPGDYDLWCLPLKLAGSDGAPARVVLVSR
jgi:arylformamidase